jgi:hypothetical protein
MPKRRECILECSFFTFFLQNILYLPIITKLKISFDTNYTFNSTRQAELILCLPNNNIN